MRDVVLIRLWSSVWPEVLPGDRIEEISPFFTLRRVRVECDYKEEWIATDSQRMP